MSETHKLYFCEAHEEWLTNENAHQHQACSMAGNITTWVTP